ncbi:MAG: DUF4422 domain-containing protein [Clostridium butyricum]|nr:DUF4422 domain-containing protein [Clostridium butyricum]MDI9210784.1 DUF4422 domain-containing protein [Clostridium butyricum]
MDKTNNNNIKIYVSCHKESYIPNNGLLYPIQVGTDLANKKFDGMLHDNEGDNISFKNKYYCELTAQYWAWKNENAKYYGFFHYRRYLSFNPIKLKEDGWGSIVYDTVSNEALSEMRIDEKCMSNIINQYDVITTIPRNIRRGSKNKHETIYTQYATENKSHKQEDMDLVIKIIQEKYPEFNEVVREYLNSYEAYECNMFIMKKEIFNEYCNWLFDILEEHEKRADFSNYSVEQYRVSGFLAERLFGIYYTYLKKNNSVKRCELQKSMFMNTDPEHVLEPAFNDKNVPIVLSANDKFSPYLSTFIESIIENSSIKFNYDLVVLHKNISNENINIIKEQINSRRNFNIRFFNTEYMLKGTKLFVDKHLSVETYFRLLIQEILPNYSKVLYLDCDMVMNCDPADLYNENIDGYLLAAVKDIDYLGVENSNQDRRDYSKDILKLDNPFEYFQAGVLILNLDEFRKKFTVHELLRVAKSYEWKHHDQDVLNCLCQGKVKFLNQKWNVIMDWKEKKKSRMDILKLAPKDVYNEYMEARKTPNIIHFAGHIKPWIHAQCDFGNNFWKYAKNTPYYEVILSNMMENLIKEKSINLKGVHRNKVEPINNDHHGIYVDGLEEAIYMDGMYIKLINKLNKMFPKGSKKRERMKKIARFFVK